MKKLLVGAVAVVAAGAAFAADLIWDVPSGTTSNVTEIIPDGAYTITVRGGGKVYYCPSDLTKTNAIPKFTGAWVIESGTLHSPHPGNMGKPKTLTVQAGGSFDFSGLTKDQSITFSQFNSAKTVVTIAGSGVNGEGALVYTKGVSSAYVFRRLILSADATINTPVGWGITSDYVDLNGHILTKAGDSSLTFRDKITVTNQNGSALLLKKGSMNLQEIYAVGDATGKILFQGGKLNPHKIPADNPVPWTLYAETTAGDATTNIVNIEVSNTKAALRLDECNYFSGPIIAKGVAYINIANSAGTLAPLNITGDVSSERLLQKYSAGCLRFFGNVTVTNGTTVQQSNSGYLRFAPAAGKELKFAKLDVRATTVVDLRNTDKPMTIRYLDSNSGVLMSASPGFAQTYIRGGESRIANKVDMGRIGRQELTIMDGAKVVTNESNSLMIHLGYSNNRQSATLRCFPTLNVIGEGTVLDLGQGDPGPNRLDDTLTMVNVAEGATLCSKYLRRRWVNSEDTTSWMVVNFDGGTYVANTNSYVSGTSSVASRYNPDCVTIYEGGLTVDTSRAAQYDTEKVITYATWTLRHPEGKGLKAVNISDNAEFMAEQYGRLPFVEFSGAGSNAYAFVEVDEETRKPTNIRIVSRGSGFDATSRVIISNSTFKTAYTFTPELYDYPVPASTQWKGFTKAGEGGLQLQATNTYYGPTTVLAGQLNFMTESRPIDSGLVVSNNATISFTSKDESAREIPFVAGAGSIIKFKNPGLTVRKLILSAREGLAGHKLTFDGKLILPAGASVEIVDTDALAAAEVKTLELCTVSSGITGTATLPTISDDWKIVQTASGFKLVKSQGAVLIVR